VSEIDSLRKSTDELLSHFTKRVEMMKNRGEYSMLVRTLDKDKALQSAISYFGEGEYRAVGIDGSMDQAETLEMLLFYVNAVAYSCPFRVSRDGITFDTYRMKKEEKIGASSAVPLWVEDLSYVSEERRAYQESNIQASLDDVSFSLMLLAELTSALNSLSLPDVKVLFLDRPLSGTFQSLGRDVRYLLRKEKSSLQNIHSGSLMRDAFLFNAVPIPEMEVPLHGPNKAYSILHKMLSDNLSLKEACSEVELSKEESDKITRAIMNLDRKYKSMQGDERLTAEAANYIKRLENTAEEVSKRLFSSTEHPLRVGENEWLTTIDLNLVNMVRLTSLIRKSIKDRRMLIGITKDTSSTDVSRSVIPVIGLSESSRPRIRHDRVMFTILSATNESTFIPPWRSIGYDAVFATLSEDEDSSMLKAARKVASREMMFVKSFFQTRASNNTIFRSPVFMYDRPFMKEFDGSFCREREYKEKNKIEHIKPYLENYGVNQLDNLILLLLASSDYPEVFEAYGHNALLYMADKAAKVDAKLKRGMLLGTINLKLTPMARKERLFTVIRRYRDTRSEVEAMRAEAETS
jgi:hypothetical protein